MSPLPESRHRPLPSGNAGVTLPELLTTIAVIGILSAVAVVSYSGIRENAQQGVAQDNVASLNRAVLHFNQANWDIVLNANPAGTADELAVLHTLKWRDPVNPTPGSPYIAENFSESVSTSNQDYRIQWNGRAFELLLPGTSGSGLQTGFDSISGVGAYSFPDNYTPLGPGQNE